MSKKEKKSVQHKTFSQKLMSGGSLILVFIFILFCFFNGVASQLVPSLYFQLIKENSQAEIAFIKTARLLPEFKQLFPEIRQTFVRHEKEIYEEERTRKKAITNLEIIREQNPQSRDVLYALSQLYAQQGNIDKATQYLEQVHALDPLLGQQE